jgi:hypothetical protein
MNPEPVLGQREGYRPRGPANEDRRHGQPGRRVRAPLDAAARSDLDQAAYFLTLLGDGRREIDDRIAGYRGEIANAQRRGDTCHADRCQRLLQDEEDERWDLQRMIDRLELRFGLRVPRKASPGSATAMRAGH